MLEWSHLAKYWDGNHKPVDQIARPGAPMGVYMSLHVLKTPKKKYTMCEGWTMLDSIGNLLEFDSTVGQCKQSIDAKQIAMYTLLLTTWQRNWGHPENA